VEPTKSPENRYLTPPGEAVQPGGEFLGDAVLPAPEPGDVDGWCTEGEADIGHLPRLGNHFGGVQQGFRWDAADVQADAAQGGPALDQNDALAEVGGPKGRCVSTRTSAYDNHVRLYVAHGTTPLG
jgi:hypothetical protein